MEGKVKGILNRITKNEKAIKVLANVAVGDENRLSQTPYSLVIYIIHIVPFAMHLQSSVGSRRA